MTASPDILILAGDKASAKRIEAALLSEGMSAYGTHSVKDAIQAMTLHLPKVIVADPATGDCSTLLNRSEGWKSIAMVAIGESKSSARISKDMGIPAVISPDDLPAIAKAVAALLAR